MKTEAVVCALGRYTATLKSHLDEEYKKALHICAYKNGT